MITALTDQNFAAEVLASPTPVMIDFFSTHCAPCKALSPIVEKLATHYAGRLKVAKLNIDDAPQTATQFGIRAVPTILFFKDGKAIDTVLGLKAERDLRKRIDPLIGATA
jgi:thioredoxin 1